MRATRHDGHANARLSNCRGAGPSGRVSVAAQPEGLALFNMTPASHSPDGGFPDRLSTWRTDRRRLVLLCVAAVFLGLAIVFGLLAFFRPPAALPPDHAAASRPLMVLPLP